MTDFKEEKSLRWSVQIGPISVDNQHVPASVSQFQISNLFGVQLESGISEGVPVVWASQILPVFVDAYLVIECANQSGRSLVVFSQLRVNSCKIVGQKNRKILPHTWYLGDSMWKERHCGRYGDAIQWCTAILAPKLRTLTQAKLTHNRSIG